jgi:hypothetical protein
LYADAARPSVTDARTNVSSQLRAAGDSGCRGAGSCVLWQASAQNLTILTGWESTR